MHACSVAHAIFNNYIYLYYYYYFLLNSHFTKKQNKKHQLYYFSLVGWLVCKQSAPYSTKRPKALNLFKLFLTRNV